MNTNPAHQLLVAHLRQQEQRIEELGADLLAAYMRNAELQRKVENLSRVLLGTRASRDEWKRRAGTYQTRCGRLYSRLYDVRRSRRMWRHRALTREVEEGRTVAPQSKAWLTRDAA